MDHSATFAHHLQFQHQHQHQHQNQHQPASFDAEKVDYGFDSLLGHDACLTHGLDSLGTCNNTENACLDQRCFDHYGKTAAAKTALEIGLERNHGDNKIAHRNDPASNTRSAKLKTRSQSNASSSSPKMTSPAATKASAHRQKRRRQSEQIQLHQQLHHRLDYQPSSLHHMHSPNMFQQNQNLQHVEPTAVLQTVNESLQHNFHMPLLDGHHPQFGNFQQHNQVFSMPSLYDRWPQAVAPSWANMMGQSTVTNCMPMSWPTHMGCNDAASADCTSACGDTKCWSECSDADDADCCFDTSCAEIDLSHAACCFEPTCVELEPCINASCQEAAIPCNDSHCVGTTVSTTPASVSVTTPSAEPEPIVNTILSPVEPGRGGPLDVSSAVSHDFGDFAHDLGHGFPEGLGEHGGNFMSRHSGLGLNQDGGFSISSLSPTPKIELAETQSIKGEPDFTCQWLCEDGVLCSKKFGGNKELQDHCKNEHVKNLNKGENGFCCTWYGCIRPGPFSQKSKLERHMQTHTGYKPVKCEICGIMLSAKQSLEQHMRTHSGEKPWKCEHPGCDARFKQQSALTMHMRTHTGEKPLQCEICGKRFGESSNLSKHRRTHNVRGNHVCEHCGKDFHRLDQLRRHMQTHLPDGSRKSSKSS